MLCLKLPADRSTCTSHHIHKLRNQPPLAQGSLVLDL